MSASVFDERKEWLEQRGNGLGGTDTSAVVNLNPWKNALDVYLGKLGLSERREPTEAMFWGNYLERGVAIQYAARTGFSVVPPEHIGKYLAEMFPALIADVWGTQTLLHHPDLPFVLGTPDGLILASSRGLEIKTSGFKGAEWGKPGTDEIPTHYRIQVAQYLAITGFDSWDVAALFSGNRLEIYTVGRDRTLEDTLLNAAADFWHNNVERRMPPPLDGSESWRRHLGKVYAIGNQTMLEPSSEAEQWATLLRDAQRSKADAEAAEGIAKNQLASLIADNKGVKLSDGGKAQWVRPRPSDSTDWEAVARSLNATPEQIAQHTKQKHNAAYVRLY
jgi:predicted phage-related endonuclease